MLRSALVARSVVGALLTLGLLGATGASASRAYGTPFPSLFVDPYGGYSVVRLPAWRSPSTDIMVGAPVRPVAVAPRPDELAADTLARAAADADRRGQTTLLVRIGQGQDARTDVLALRTLGTVEILWFYALYVLAGLLLLWSGVAVALVAWSRPGGRAYFALTVVAFVFLVTFLDYQTTRWLAPLFAATTLGNAVSILALAWSFPAPPPARPAVRRAARVLLGLGVAASLLLAVAVPLRLDLRPLRQLSDAMMPISLLALIGAVVWRTVRGTDAHRAELRSAAVGLVVVPLVLGLVVAALALAGEIEWFHMLLPFASIALPAAIGNALVRHNVFAIRTVLSRRLAMVPVFLIALAVGVGVAAQLWHPGARATVVLMLAVAAAITLAGWIGVDRWLAGAEATFRPSLDTLAEDVATLRTPGAIRDRVGALVRRCLPTREVATMADDEQASLGLTREAASRLRAGETVWTRPEDGTPPSLVAPLRFGGESLGIVRVSPREGDPVFGEGEVRILQTILSLGALALHHAELLREVEERRAIELAATKGDKRLAVDVVAAEIAHELAYPVGFLRHFLKQVGQGRASPDVIEVGQDEVDRLERMLAWVRKLQMPPPSIGQVRVAHVVTKLLILLEGDLAARAVSCAIDVHEDLFVHAESDALLQLLANLLRNAAQHARSAVGIRAATLPNDVIELRVWDDGPGVPPEIASRIFDPLFTTQSESEGHGLGLAVAQRVARGFGWSIEVRREDATTVFAVRVKRRTERAPLERVAS